MQTTDVWKSGQDTCEGKVECLLPLTEKITQNLLDEATQNGPSLSAIQRDIQNSNGEIRRAAISAIGDLEINASVLNAFGFFAEQFSKFPATSFEAQGIQAGMKSLLAKALTHGEEPIRQQAEALQLAYTCLGYLPGRIPECNQPDSALRVYMAMQQAVGNMLQPPSRFPSAMDEKLEQFIDWAKVNTDVGWKLKKQGFAEQVTQTGIDSSTPWLSRMSLEHWDDVDEIRTFPESLREKRVTERVLWGGAALSGALFIVIVQLVSLRKILSFLHLNLLLRLDRQ